MNAKTDDNYEPTSLVVDDVNTLPANLLVEPFFGRLEIDVLAATSFNDVVASTLKEDDNRIPIAKAVTDDANNSVRLLKVDSNNRLIIDLVVE
jgi:hypothetical protein